MRRSSFNKELATKNICLTTDLFTDSYFSRIFNGIVAFLGNFSMALHRTINI